MLLNDTRCCTQCGRTGVTRHTCPLCPCNYCKRNGHSADKCERAQRSRRTQPVGNSANGNPVASGPLSNPFSNKPRRRQPQLPPNRRNADLTAGSGSAAAISAGGDRSSVPSSEPPERGYSQDSRSHDTSLSSKRKMKFESEDARKKINTTPTVLPPGLSRSPDDADVLPLLNAEIVRLGCVSTVFPELEPLAVHILMKLTSQECPAHLKHYQHDIDTYGGTQKVLIDMMAAIDPEFRSLQGKNVTLEALRGISRNQALEELLWDAEGGYLDYITDTRCDFYFRLYVGQAIYLVDRVATHVAAMARGDVSTLHYYVKSLGGIHRNANFLRAFRISNSDSNQFDRDLVKNLLELEICVALRTLPQKELVQWLPHGEREVKFPSVHLNVANPLVQGSFLSASVRQNSRSLLLDSADPEVRQWPNLRNKQLASKPRRSAAIVPYVPLGAYATIFNDTVQANAGKLGELQPFNSDLRVPFDENFPLENCQQAISEHLDHPVPLIGPSGSLDSRIAIILSGVESFHSGGQSIFSSTINQEDDGVPYGLREMGLSARNSLIWPFNLRQFGIFRPEEMSTVVAATEAAYFRNYSLSLIAASSARFVLVCGEMGQQYLFDEVQELSSPIEITLRGYNIALRFQLDGTHIQRVFVATPDPQNLMRGGDWRSMQKFAQIVRLAAGLTKMEAIVDNFFENNLAYASIFRAVAEEKTSSMPLTIDLLDSGLRQWLARKGFQTDEDIEELTSLVGSLADGLFILICSLPKRPKVTVSRVRSCDRRVVKGPKYSKELLTAVRNLRQKKIRKYCPTLVEEDHDKLPDVARINVSQKRSDQDTNGDGELHKSDTSEDDFEQPNDEPASMMEISLNITDEPVLEIAMVHDTGHYQRREMQRVGGKKGAQIRRENLVRKLYEGSLYDLRASHGLKRPSHYVQVLEILLRVPTRIDLDAERQATVKAELADKGSKQDDTRRLAMHENATTTAQRLAVSVRVFRKDGNSVTFWAQKASEKDAQRTHRLVEELDAFRAEEATEPLE